MNKLINREALKALMIRLAPKDLEAPTAVDVEQFAQTFERMILEKLMIAIQIVDNETRPEAKTKKDVN